MTKEEAKIWLNKLYARADITDEYGDMEDMQPYVEAIDTVTKTIDQTTWIPCSKRLPEEDGAYLVTVEMVVGKPRIDIRSYAKDLNKVDEYDFPEHKCGWYDYDSEFGHWEDTAVTAWMPLPAKPYKAESEE